MSDLAVIRVVVILAIVAGLAYLIGRPKAKAWQRRVGIAQVAVVGLPLVLLGMILRAPGVDVLDDAVLDSLAPVLAIALATIGMRIGMRVDVGQLLGTDRDVALLVGARALVGWLGIGGALLAYLAWRGGGELATSEVRNVLVLVLAGTVTSSSAIRGATGIQAAEDARLSERVARIEELIGVVGLLVVTAAIRPAGDVHELSPELWLLVAIGLGGVVGVLLYALSRDRAMASHDAPVLVLGGIAITAGVALVLHLSPLTVGLLAGVVLGHLARAERQGFEAALAGIERPIYSFFLFVIGAMCLPLTWAAAGLAAVFVAVRYVARWAGTALGLRAGGITVDGETLRRLAVSPLGASSIALVASVQALYPDDVLAPVALGMVAATVLAEVLLRATVPVAEARCAR